MLASRCSRNKSTSPILLKPSMGNYQAIVYFSCHSRHCARRLTTYRSALVLRLERKIELSAIVSESLNCAFFFEFMCLKSGHFHTQLCTKCMGNQHKFPQVVLVYVLLLSLIEYYTIIVTKLYSFLDVHNNQLYANMYAYLPLFYKKTKKKKQPLYNWIITSTTIQYSLITPQRDYK